VTRAEIGFPVNKRYMTRPKMKAQDRIQARMAPIRKTERTKNDFNILINFPFQ